MSKSKTSSKNSILLIGASVVMAVVLYLVWQYAGTVSAPPTPVAEKKKSSDTKIQPLAPSVASGTGATPTQPATQLTTVEEGDEMIDQIIRSEKEIPEMARDLHELVKKLNGEAQVNASQHLINLTSDEDYSLISGFLVDEKMNPDVIEVLFSDLMNRDRSLQLPLFMNILKNPKHPQNEEVRNVMTVLAGEDFENDFAAWDKWASEELRSLQE